MPLYLPDARLPSTFGVPVNLWRYRGTTVLFVYPYTGKVGVENPPGWDDIPGAHGSTPQILAYKALSEDFRALQVQLLGMSFQRPEWQEEFAMLHNLPFLLICDINARIALKLGLKIFSTGETAYLERRTLVIRDGIVIHDRKSIPKPENDARDVLKWLRAQ